MGDRTLRAALTALVLLNLLFVHLTEAARPAWVVALTALTLLSPFLIPWRERLVYRGSWNLAVVGVFTLLLHHATASELRYVLEDGLVLAALCQVHLLNNLRAEQRPDLLFLNSFLIAVVTGYLSQDVTFAVGFAVYVPVLVTALCLYDLIRLEGLGAAIDRRAFLGPVLRDGLARSALLGLATLGVFALWPRDFQRRGLLADYVESSGGGDEVGFDDSLSLERGGQAEASDEIVMRVTLEVGARRDVPLLWRGATLMGTNGDRWWPFADRALGRGFASDAPWRSGDGSSSGANGEFAPWLVRGEGLGELARVRVENVDGSSNRLFTPLSAERLGFDQPPRASLVARGDATLVFGEPGVEHGAVTYRLGLGPAPGTAGGPALRGPIPRRVERDLRPYVELPPSPRIRAAVDLASELALEVSGGEQRELVTHFSDYLADEHLWLAPGAEGAAGTLEEFLAPGGAGHCEFFASALATMLRSRGVPSRVVTGYRSGEWDAEARVLTFRRRHAHAWVEVLDPSAGWYAVDPNPAPALESGPSALARLRAELELAWVQLTAFDSERRAELLARLRGLPGELSGRLVGFARTSPAGALGGGLALALAALGLAWLWSRWLARGVGAIERSYRRALRSAGLSLASGETPRELLARARSGNLEPRHLERLEAATHMHERSRYGARALSGG